MACLIPDESGQWIALSGLTISISMITVAILINQAAVTGYYSSYAALEFPKEQIRELKTETQESARNAAYAAWMLSNDTNSSVFSNFTHLLESYAIQVNTIYAFHGGTVNISIYNYSINNDSYIYMPGNITVFNSTTHYMNVIWLNISYDDGTTRYASTPEVIEVDP